MAVNDYEIDVFDAVATYEDFSELVPEGNFRSEYVPEPESFPLCTLIRMDSVPDWRRQGNGSSDDYTVDSYEAHVYALDMDECKAIMNVLADRMGQMNFRRTTMRPVLNGNDITVKHMVARFENRSDSRGYLYR